MTKHNLKTHLSWLLTAKPFVPPAGQHIVLPVSDVPHSSGILSSQDVAAELLDSSRDASAHELPRSQPVVPQFRPRQPSSRRDSIEKTAATLDCDDSNSDSHTIPTGMAKLRAAPGSTSKPRLISQAYSSDRTPIAGSSNRFREKLAAVSTDAPKSRLDCAETHPNAYSSSTAKKNAGPRGRQVEEWDIADVDAIDLTGDSDNRTGSSPSVHVPASTSRKRKSDQFEAHSEGSPACQRPRLQNRPAEVLATDDYAPIEDFEDPPPPYSTVAQKSAALAAEPQHILEDDDEFGDLQAESLLDAFDDNEQRVLESPLKSVPKKRKPLSRVPSDNSERNMGAVTLRKPSRSPKKVNWNSRDLPVEESRSSPAKASRQTKRRIIADSEDEDDLDFDDTDVKQPLRISPPENETPHLGSPTRSFGLEQSTIDTLKDFRWHECKGGPLSFVHPPKQPQETATKQVPHSSSSSSFKVPSATVMHENGIATPSSCQASSSGLSKEEKQAVSKFASWPETFLQTVCRDLEAEVQQLKVAQTEYLEEYEVPSWELIGKSKSAHKRKGVIENLVDTRRHFIKASVKKKELSDRVLALMDTEYSHDLTDFHETEAQFKVASEQLRHLEVEMIQSMRSAGFLEGEGQSVHLCEPPNTTSTDVVVCSTQAVPGSRLKEKQRAYEPNELHPTQFVQQTQISQRSPRVPSKRNGPLPPISHEESHSVPQQIDLGKFADEDFDDDAFDDVSFQHLVSEQIERRNSGNTYSGPSKVKVSQILDDRVDRFDENDIEENEEAFGTNMGTPPADFMEEEDDDEYGDFDINEEDMCNMAEDVENSNTVDWGQDSRHVFQETSGNRVRQITGRDASKKKQGTKSSTSMAPPANQPTFPWTGDVKKTLKDRFRLRGFRPHQLEAINATLAGKDCFVLMPTGGGKSLCYQLPAVVQSGRTRGVTVVISPLLSLMEDQVSHLKALHIQAFHINGELSYEQRRFIMNALREPQVEKFIQVLYVTPEMLSKNQAMVNLLQDLHRRQQFARIVIDEAHCVSQWGHDFRPDYKALGEVRRQFQGVPVMALTATATENVKVDVIHNLGIQGCEVFAQSFNRPNLFYEVRSKGKREDILQNIADIIKTGYRAQSGIVYCLSRKKCELVAQQLREKHNISAQHYHAGMDPEQKSETQKAWQAGRYKVIVATIAFGMGIDKPDVRFVIHHSIPKSLEGYYQETGRAGRDGKRSGCYLFYGYQDTNILRKMIDEGDGSQQQKERQYAMLRNVVQFCENTADCRRVQVLAYFNESFKAEDCNAECDNCNSTITFEHRDFTDLAAKAVDLVERIHKQKVTLLHCVDVFRGGYAKRIKELGHDSLREYGSGSELERGDAERLFQRLVSEGALEEDNRVNRGGFATPYIKLGKSFRIFQARKRRIEIHVRVSPQQAKSKKTKPATAKRKGTGVAAARDDYPLSTNVSSPVQVASRVRHKARVADMDDDDGFVDNTAAEFEAEDESEAFELPPQPRSRMISMSSKACRQKLGPPITIDEKMARLDEVHQDVVEAFVLEGRKECQKILIARSLRAHPFTDTVLREMAISFPETQRELLEIPGIDRQMVMLHGERFLKLIKKFKNNFESMSGQMQQQQQQQQQQQHPDTVKDPNHEIIEISDEDDGEDEANYDEEDFNLDDSQQSSDEIRSSYFQPPEPDPEVEAFNAQFSQAQASAKATAGPAVGRSTRAAPITHRYASSTSGKRSYFRKGSRRSSAGGYSRSRGSTGVTKKTSKRRGGGGGPSNFSKKEGGGGGGGIAMMPI